MGKRKADKLENNELAPLPLMPERKKAQQAADSDACFVGKPIPAKEAKEKWPLRYPSKNKVDKKDLAPSNTEGLNEEDKLQARCHYSQAVVDGVIYNLYDDAYVKAEDGKPDYIAKIIELFESVDREPHFMAQWFFRAEDTAIKDHADLIDTKRVFMSDVKDDNPLNCIVSKVKILQLSPNVDSVAKEELVQASDLYYDMKYTVPYLTFSNIATEKSSTVSDATSTISSETGSNIPIGDDVANGVVDEIEKSNASLTSEWTLLDLYSGCGAMSTGLCLGAAISGVKLVTRWAVDYNTYACKSLKLNHPETEVRNEKAEDFLSLLKAWDKLCNEFVFSASDGCNTDAEDDENEKNDDSDKGSNIDSEEFEVQKLLAVCYGNPNGEKKEGLYFKVRWKGYGPSDDTWEPIDGLSNCKEKLQDFVMRGYKSKLLPRPGDVDFICGGPPCQGVSGFNRFRNKNAPLDDAKNRQLLVYMDIIDYLKPKYVLMENVVDILKFAGGFLGRYAIGRLVSMSYQARMGMMAAGSYGVPQFRMRVFLWGARHTEKLPQYPLPTHEVVARGGIPNEFEEIAVAYDNKQSYKLADALCLKDAISDLPPVTNLNEEDERKYGPAAHTEFQKYIRLKRNEMVNRVTISQSTSQPRMLYDHRPLKLNEDDFERVNRIPKKKGANYRDLPGIIVNSENKAEWDPSVERLLVASGKPLIPDYAIKFVKGKSTKPFGRLWWDEIVATVVTRAEPHNQAIIHPSQDRVLTIRENARLQGFPDCYQLCGPVKERYMQVGNAVAVPVALALGYTFGLACQGLSDDKPLTVLPFKFPSCLVESSSADSS
ncbi:Cytosine-specific methyltransferase [Quillaja saponaria]|uniref:DNA (cytosine-5-)-methyltransferase n=1 Tax=Quillaja saponaria TaxID=32244 RepID=A0AAD7KSD4_QUISA|nr:Cytosine-specific methyltransferase [Quillaja saponaria]